MHRKLADIFGDEKAEDIMRNLSQQGDINAIYQVYNIARALSQRKLWSSDKITYCLRILCISNTLQVMRYPNKSTFNPSTQHICDYGIIMYTNSGGLLLTRHDPLNMMEDVYQAGIMELGGVDVQEIL